MPCLNDIDEKIIKKEYIFELLDYLDNKEQKALFGFYLRFIRYNVKYYKMNQCVHPALKKVLNILLTNHWIPFYLKRLVDVIDSLNATNFEKLISCICDYLTETNEVRNIVRENKYKTFAKVMILENIKLIN
jgi:hypothetical protein